jgi:membrane protein YdbS with pleckstrin-like domain
MSYFGLRVNVMNKKIIKPSSNYVWKLRLILVLVALAVLVVGFIISFIIILEGNVEGSLALILATIVINILWWIPGMLLTGPYCHSLGYEIQDDEVIVNVGVITKTVKHVPYRTVTNITINRGPLDRWIFKIGTLKIQTAGMSGQTGAEEELVGLENVQEVYEMVVNELRKFRGGMTPTAADEEIDLSTKPAIMLEEVLEELRAIRGAIESRT